MNSNFLIYGAYGYTGSLIARMAAEAGLQPILSGRKEEPLAELAGELGLEYRVIDLQESDALDRALEEVGAVIHCAGPFINTAQAMADACLRTHTHYLDITGEIDVFEGMAGRDAEAKAVGIMLLPGAGFDVVPTDCLALHLKERLPTANRLTLAIRGMSSISHGTAITAIESIGNGVSGMIRRNGELVPVPAGWQTRLADFGKGPTLTVSIPWGDVSSAYYSTDIPNIEVYMAASPRMVRGMVVGRYVSWLLRARPVQSFLKSRIKAGPAGPSDEVRATAVSRIWGLAQDGAGRQVISRLQTPEGYQLTALTTLAIVQKVLAGNAPVGFQTPAKAYGADLIMEIEGVVREDVPIPDSPTSNPPAMASNG